MWYASAADVYLVGHVLQDMYETDIAAGSCPKVPFAVTLKLHQQGKGCLAFAIVFDEQGKIIGIKHFRF